MILRGKIKVIFLRHCWEICSDADMAKFVQEKTDKLWYINLQITGKFTMQRKKYKNDYLDKVIIKIDFQTEKN
ncbi:hypothetical protein I5282_03910 [Legionella sp. 30cs62]|uniref:Uncharacterized protein n=1 Tax=Legionella bononiensis TaxID=2793102 RepID=A0ABS1W8Q5_9GAMM|nr:hypothetical protein [Legionella bononiensis]